MDLGNKSWFSFWEIQIGNLIRLSKSCLSPSWFWKKGMRRQESWREKSEIRAHSSHTAWRILTIYYLCKIFGRMDVRSEPLLIFRFQMFQIEFRFSGNNVLRHSWKAVNFNFKPNIRKNFLPNKTKMFVFQVGVNSFSRCIKVWPNVILIQAALYWAGPFFTLFGCMRSGQGHLKWQTIASKLCVNNWWIVTSMTFW